MRRGSRAIEATYVVHECGVGAYRVGGTGEVVRWKVCGVMDIGLKGAWEGEGGVCDCVGRLFSLWRGRLVECKRRWEIISMEGRLSKVHEMVRCLTLHA